MAKANNKKEIKEELEKEKRIAKEIKKIKDMIKDVDKTTVKGIDSLISNTAFMAITLEDLVQTMNNEGLTCEYQNGENQFGIKKSPEIDIYNTMIKNYIAAMSKILSLSPNGQAVLDDGFGDFINGKKKKK